MPLISITTTKSPPKPPVPSTRRRPLISLGRRLLECRILGLQFLRCVVFCWRNPIHTQCMLGVFTVPTFTYYIHLGFGFGVIVCFWFYHGKSLLNHHLGNIVEFVQASKKQIQVNRRYIESLGFSDSRLVFWEIENPRVNERNKLSCFFCFVLFASHVVVLSPGSCYSWQVNGGVGFGRYRSTLIFSIDFKVIHACWKVVFLKTNRRNIPQWTRGLSTR